MNWKNTGTTLNSAIYQSIGKDIEKYIIKVLGSSGVEVESYDIVAVHCLERHINNISTT